MNEFLYHYLFCLRSKDGFCLYRIARDRRDLRFRYGDSFVDHFDAIDEVLYITPLVFSGIEAFKLSNNI